MKIELKRVNNLIEEETSSRTFFNKEIEKKSSLLGSKITEIVSTISNSDLGNLKEKISQLEISTSIINDKISSQPDLEVTIYDSIINESNYHDSASHSVGGSPQIYTAHQKQVPGLKINKINTISLFSI